MKHLQRIAKVAKGAVEATSFPMGAAIMQAGVFLIDSGNAVSDDYEALEKLFSRIHDMSERLNEYIGGGDDGDDEPGQQKVVVQMDHRLRRMVVRLMCSIIDVFGDAEAAMKRGRGREMLRHVAGKESRIQETLRKMDEKLLAEMQLLMAKNLSTAQQLRAGVEMDRSSGQLRELLKTDATRANATVAQDIIRQRIPNSGEWLLREKEYQMWVTMTGDVEKTATDNYATTSSFPVLFVFGGPGTGKTFAASRVIHELCKNPCIVVAYFYILEGMKLRHTPEDILKTLAAQVAAVHEPYRRYILHKSHGPDQDTLMAGPEAIWDNMFIQPFSNVPEIYARPLYIVIDGVDEALSEHQELLVQLAKLLSEARRDGSSCTETSKLAKGKLNQSALVAVQLLLVGRPELEYRISSIWGQYCEQSYKIHLHEELSKKDIGRFIRRGVDGEIGKDGSPVAGTQLLRKMPPKAAKHLRREIIDALSKNAGGMFLLVKLMLAEIRNMNKPALVRQTLAKPPSGLDDMFRRVIARLVDARGFDKDDLNELIMWVACAQRDLRLGELDHIIKIRDPDQEGIIGLEDELRTRFGSFFTVVHAEADDERETEWQEKWVKKKKVKKEAEVAARNERITTHDAGRSNDDVYNRDSSEDENYITADESDDEVPIAFTRATVKFSHASIGQYFRGAESGCYEDIGMDVRRSETHIAATLCRALLTEDREPWQSNPLYHYAATYFLDHLLQAGGFDADHRRIATNDEDSSDNKDSQGMAALTRAIWHLFSDRLSLLTWLNVVTNRRRLLCQLFSEPVLTRLHSCLLGVTENLAVRWRREMTGDSEVQIWPLHAEWLKQIQTTKSACLSLFAQFVAQYWTMFEQGGFSSILFLHGYDALVSWANSFLHCHLSLSLSLSLSLLCSHNS